MKRRARESYNYNIRKKFSFVSWVKCCCCEFEFVREWMWVCEVGPYHGGSGRLIHFCENCAPNTVVACEIIEKRNLNDD